MSRTGRSIPIAVDARWIFREISGIGEYTRELIRALAALDRKNRYVLLFDNADVRARTLAETGVRDAPNVTSVLLPWGLFSVRNQLLLPRALRRRGIEVFHATNYMIPFLAFPRRRTGAVRCVTTIHDVIPLLFPDHGPRSRKTRLFALYRRVMIEAGARSDFILTDSRAAREDLLGPLRIPPAEADKVRAIYCGVAERFRSAAPPAARPAAGGDAAVLLYVGRCDPYKNLPLAVRALAAARQACPGPVRLAVAGAPDPRYPEAIRLADRLGLRDAVHWLGYLPDEELVRAYQRADLLVHPSRYEGFGLQVAEALAAGLPVVCTNAGALPEVAGDAALLTDPGDEDGFVRNVVRVLREPELARDLSARGRRQAARFTWRRTAEQTLAVYEEAALGGNRP